MWRSPNTADAVLGAKDASHADRQWRLRARDVVKGLPGPNPAGPGELGSPAQQSLSRNICIPHLLLLWGQVLSKDFLGS